MASTLPPFSSQQVQQVARSVGETADGLTGPEIVLTTLLLVHRKLDKVTLKRHSEPVVGRRKLANAQQRRVQVVDAKKGSQKASPCINQKSSVSVIQDDT